MAESDGLKQGSEASAGEKFRVLCLILIMTVVVMLSGAVAITLLYQAAFEEDRLHLSYIVKSQARLMEAVARFDQKFSSDYPDGARGATIAQIREARQYFKGFGETGEFTLARRDGDNIVFILRHRHSDVLKPAPIAFTSKLAVPMRLALSGKSGTIVGLDYRGVTVLAAYEPVAVLKLGIVAKMDLSEIRAPFVTSALISGAGSILLAIIGAILFLRISNPVMQRLKDQAIELMGANKTLWLEISEREIAEQELTIRATQQEALAKISQLLLVNEDLTELMNKALAVIADTFDVKLCKILELLPDGSKLLLKAGVGWNQGLVGNCVLGTETHSQAGYTLLQDKPVIVLNLPTEKRFGGPKLLHDHGVVSGMSVVIAGPRGPYGVLGVHSATSRNFTEDDANFLQTVAHTLSGAIERHHSQAQLIQAGKLATLGEMATGMAHELNQPLNVIKMAADSAAERIEDGRFDAEFDQGKFERISAQVDRAAAIIDHMRIFGRADEGTAETFDPVECMTGALGLLGEQLRLREIEIETRFAESRRQVLGHPAQLEQVLLNLIGNSRDAIESNGDGAGKSRKITLVVEDLGPEDCIRLTVGDTGGGIPEGVINRIFDPFFTTKDPGKGTGLGLSISYGIVTEMGGMIEAVNYNGGAEFTVSLPVVAETGVAETGVAGAKAG